MEDKTVKVECPCGCNQKHLVTPSHARRSNFQGFISGHNMQDKTGLDHPASKGGLHFDTFEKRWKVTTRDRKRIRFARVIMEPFLQPGLVVHHINSDSSDDRIENLQVMTFGEHSRIHHGGGVH